MCLHTPPYLRVWYTSDSQQCGNCKCDCILLPFWECMGNALSFKKMYTLWGLSRLGIKVQCQKRANVSFPVIFGGKGIMYP